MEDRIGLRPIIRLATIAGMDYGPLLTVYPADHPTGSSVIIFPGGGYAGLAHHEGEPVARWLNTLGIRAFVCHYLRRATSRHPFPLGAALGAVRSVRMDAVPSGHDPHRIGVMGFSAGGHLAATLCAQADESARPTSAVLCYPVVTMADPYTHAGSRENLLGPSPSAEWIDGMSADRQVTARTPPTFVWHTADDEVVPVENALLYATALRANGVPFELHVYAHGRHGVGLAGDDPVLRTWTERCAAWLKGRGF